MRSNRYVPNDPENSRRARIDRSWQANILNAPISDYEREINSEEDIRNGTWVRSPVGHIRGCPFCGSCAKIFKTCGQWRIICQSVDLCGAQMVGESSPAELATRWNARYRATKPKGPGHVMIKGSVVGHASTSRGKFDPDEIEDEPQAGIGDGE
jgi:hypothetical protein